MRAVHLTAYAAQPAPVPADLPRPSPGAGQVLVRVAASSVNPIDWKLGTGKLRLLLPKTLPLVPGYDVAGVVEAMGPGVTGFSPGQRVHARMTTEGASAEYALVGTDQLTLMPEGLDFAQAAGLPLAGMTALQGLRDVAGVPVSGATQRVLVVGASGGVGHLGVQIARAMGATVVGVCSARNADLVRRLGAHDVVDYAAADPYRGQAPFDVVLDCVGGPTDALTPRLKPGGVLASTVPTPALFLRGAFNALASVKVKPVLLKPTAQDLAVLDAWAAQGKLKVEVDSRFPLEKLADAWARSMGGRAVGKIILDVASA